LPGARCIAWPAVVGAPLLGDRLCAVPLLGGARNPPGGGPALGGARYLPEEGGPTLGATAAAAIFVATAAESKSAIAALPKIGVTSMQYSPPAVIRTFGFGAFVAGNCSPVAR